MWYKKRWLTEPDAEAMLEAKDKKIEELTEKLFSDDRQISAYDIEANELRDKLQSDDRQISEYDRELRQAKRLLKAAVEDNTRVLRENFGDICQFCKHYSNSEAQCCKPHNGSGSWCCENAEWRHADEALALIGGESDD